MKYTYIGHIGQQQFVADRYMPIQEVYGVGPGWLVVKYKAVYVQSANDPIM